jgi:cytochrome c-type biogenesis protein CcmF
MMIAHIGLGVFILGVTFVNNYSLTTDQAVQMNQSINFAGSEWLFSDLNEVEGPNYRAIEAEIIYTNDDDTILFYPQRRIYTQNQNAMTEAAIDGAISRDLFVAIGDAIDSNEWQFRFQYRPFIRCIWFGALIMALGGLLAAFKHYFFNKSDLIKP